MIANGQVEQAAELCSEVTEALVSDLFNSKQAYKQYVDLWDLQRRHPVSEANTDLDFSAPSKQVCTCKSIVGCSTIRLQNWQNILSLQCLCCHTAHLATCLVLGRPRSVMRWRKQNRSLSM
jgi:hypothetical protein